MESPEFPAVEGGDFIADLFLFGAYLGLGANLAVVILLSQPQQQVRIALLAL